MLSFQGLEEFSVPPERLFAAVTDLDILAATIPDLESSERTGPNTLQCVVRPGLGFLRGTLRMSIELADLRPPESAAMRITAQGIGAQIKIVSQLRIGAADEGSWLEWSAEVTELKGLIATISSGLVRAAAEKIIRAGWESLRTKIDT